MIKYENKIVCFIDILGFRNLVNDTEKDPQKVYDILSDIRTAITDWSKVAISQNIDLKITQFSDSIVFSFNPVKHYFMTFHFFKELSVNMVLKHGVIFRGGITYGKIHHDNELVFGPGMIQAYDLESKIASVPRIIIDKAALDLTNEDGKTIKDYPGQFVFKIEETGYSYVDYIVDVYPYAMDRTSYYVKLKGIILKGLECEDEKVKAKYQWMKEQYNLAKANFPELQPM
jgi:hypothetical protein